MPSNIIVNILKPDSMKRSQYDFEVHLSIQYYYLWDVTPVSLGDIYYFSEVFLNTRYFFFRRLISFLIYGNLMFCVICLLFDFFIDLHKTCK